MGLHNKPPPAVEAKKHCESAKDLTLAQCLKIEFWLGCQLSEEKIIHQKGGKRELLVRLDPK